MYNELGQLEKSISTDETGTSTSIVYTYDAVGNRDTMTDNKTLCTTTYQYNQLNQLKSSVTVNNFTKKEISKVAYSYDANGNETSKVDSITGENITYQYDVQNRLIYVSGKKADGTTYTQENRYNGTGQRIYKRDTEIKEKTTIDVTNYYYQNEMVAYTTDESGKLKTFNYYGPDNNVISTTRYNPNGTVAYYVYNKDVQGSTTNIIDSNGNSCIGYTYDDFGSATVYNVNSSMQNEITYTGAIFDNSTGLYYMNARYYDSKIGRFISQDTYRGEKNDAGTWHLYTYCANNPINYVDPSGHYAISLSYVAFKVIFAAAVAITAVCAMSATIKIAGQRYAAISEIVKSLQKNTKLCYAAERRENNVYISPKALTISEAASRIRRGLDTYTFLESTAMKIVRTAGFSVSKSEHHKKLFSRGKYYRHYHPVRRNGSHSFYGTPVR